MDERCLYFFNPIFQAVSRANFLSEFLDREIFVLHFTGDPPTEAPVPAPTYA